MTHTNTEMPSAQDRLRDSDEMLAVVETLGALAKEYGLPVIQAYVALDERLRSLGKYEDPYDPQPEPSVFEFDPKDLEETNFRIDSAGWEERTDPNGVRYRINPEGDVMELVDTPDISGEFVGEQYFSLGAAERELSKAGKRTMFPGEWDSFAERHSDWMRENLPLAGFADKMLIMGMGTTGHYWNHPFPEMPARGIPLASWTVYSEVETNPDYRFSIRCLKH